MIETKNYGLKLITITLCVMLCTPHVCAESSQSREYSIKAAFLYNFIQFVDWPQEKEADSNEPITIVILGKDPFQNAFEVLKDKQVKGKYVTIKKFRDFEELEKSGQNHNNQSNPTIETIRNCDLLFVCSSEKGNLGKIITSLREHSVLTVSDMDGFLNAGGIINFLLEEKKVRFEINLKAAKQANLKIRSKLLRLAKRVVE